MPTATLSSSDQHLTPRSAIRYRPFLSTGKNDFLDIPSFVRQTSHKDTVTAPTRPSSPPLVPVKQQERQGNTHYLLFICLGMVGTCVLIVLSQYLWSLGVVWWDDLHYGRPRTFQIDAVVGHHDSPTHPSHFIAVNNHGQIEVIEVPGNDPTHPHLYLGPQLLSSGDELVPVTISFITQGKKQYPDMVVHVQQMTLIFQNNGDIFQTPAP